jgi:hypothetical protein
MNERIRELYLKAGFHPPVTTRMGDEYKFEKFAELLIRECADRVAGSVVRDKGHIPQDPHSQGWNDAVAYASRELKKYFGVE